MATEARHKVGSFSRAERHPFVRFLLKILAAKRSEGLGSSASEYEYRSANRLTVVFSVLHWSEKQLQPSQIFAWRRIEFIEEGNGNLLVGHHARDLREGRIQLLEIRFLPKIV